MKVYLPKRLEYYFIQLLNYNKQITSGYQFEFVTDTVFELLRDNPHVMKEIEKSAKDLEIARIKSEMSDNLTKHQQLLDKLKELEK